MIFSLIAILTRVALYLNHTLCNTGFYSDTSIRLLTNFNFSWQISKAIFLSTYSWIKSESFPQLTSHYFLDSVIHTHYWICPQIIASCYTCTDEEKTHFYFFLFFFFFLTEVGRGGWMCRQGSIIQPSKPYQSMKILFFNIAE